MPKVYKFTNPEETTESYWFWCPGCESYHAYTTKGRTEWQFNGDVEKPTFVPSLLVDGSNAEKRCHLFMTEGRITFLSDCHHELAGKLVECPEWDDFGTESGTQLIVVECSWDDSQCKVVYREGMKAEALVEAACKLVGWDKEHIRLQHNENVLNSNDIVSIKDGDTFILTVAGDGV